MNPRIIGFLSAVLLLFYVHAVAATTNGPDSEPALRALGSAVAQCGGYGASECPRYEIRSNSAEAGKGAAVLSNESFGRRGKSGYAVAEYAGAKQAGDSSGAANPSPSGPGESSPVSDLQQCKIGCAPQCNAFGNADLAAQCRETCEAKCDATFGKK